MWTAQQSQDSNEVSCRLLFVINAVNMFVLKVTQRQNSRTSNNIQVATNKYC